jgi:hypothetical protein
MPIAVFNLHSHFRPVDSGGFIMLRTIKQRFQRMPKSVALIGAFIAGIALASALFFIFRANSKASDNLLPRAARVERVDGSVGLTHSQALEDQAKLDWEEASKNATLVTGDRIYAREGSRASVAFTGRNYARLDSGSALDILSLADRRTQLALRNGSAIFDIGELGDGELFEVATPNGAFDFDEPGLYQLGIGDDGNAWISVLSGLAQVVGLEGTGRVGRGEMLTLVGEAATQILLAKLSPDYAGGIVNDYYGDRYPDSYDGRYSSYDAYVDDPYYYDSYRRSVSYQYVPDDIPGAYDLDTYGDWTNIEGYGHCWSPRVEADWVPYRDGYWDTGSVYGPTWISQEPWGWAPYHYGRWAYVNNRQWVWVPQFVEQTVYAPALVAFVPITRSQQIGWVPLAPGEAYVPRCYDANFQPQYFASPAEVAQVINVQQTYVNFNYPQAVTVVPVQEFRQVIEPGVIVPVNTQYIAQTQPVLDPFTIEGVRQVALADVNDRRRFKMARAFNNQVLNTPVVTSVAPVVLPGREAMNEALQVATVPEQRRKNKLKVEDSGQVVTAFSQDGLARASKPQANAAPGLQERNQQIQELANRSAQGDKAARHELKRLAREQEMRQPNAANPANGQLQGRDYKGLIQSPAGEAAQNPRKMQKQLDRQQMSVVEQQRAQMQQTQELTRQQRKAQRRLEEQRNLTVQQQSPAVQKQQMRAAQQAAETPQVDQRRAQKQAMREQRQVQQQQQAAQQQANQQQLQKQQMKQQRQMQEQQMQQRRAQEQVNQQQQLKQQMKQQRRMQEQQAQQQMQQRQMQQQQIQQQQYKQQMKQQRRVQEQQMQQRQIQEQQMNQQRQMKQQRQMQEQQQMRQQQMQQQQQQQIQQQRKAERRAVQQQQAPQVVQPQQRPQGPPARTDAGAAEQQRRAEKAQRKAGKGNQ